MAAIHRVSWGLGVAAVTLLMLVTGRSDGAQKNSAPPGASDEISVTVVEVPVEVTRGSEPVQGLTAADFEVVEKGRSLPIVAFEAIDLEAPEKPGAQPLPPAARRHLLFLFDFAFSNPERIAQGVTEARKLVASGLDPRDMLGVGVYLPKGELHLLLSFTTDRAAAARTLGALESVLTGKAAEVPGGDSDPLRVTGLGARSLLAQAWKIKETNFAAEMLASLGASDGTMGGFLQKNVLSHSSRLHQPHVESLQRSHVMAQAEALAGLAETLRPVQGRKYLALFSDGFPVELVNRQPSSFWDPYSGGSNLLKKLESTVEELRRSGWLLHVVDLAGARSVDLGGNGLFYLANETGGTMVEGTNKLAEGLGGAMKKSAHGYLLTVQVDAAPDGAFHPLEVRLRNGQRAKVLHRSGYFAALPFQRQKDVQRLAEAARLVAGDEERDDLGIQVMAVPLRSGGESTPVAVVVEVPGAPILAAHAPKLGLEVFGYALDDQGNSNDFFAQAVELDRSKVGTRLAEGGVRVLGKLDLGPGKHRLRVLVRDRNDGRVSLLSLPLSLAATAEAAARIDALFLPPSGDPWLLVRPSDAAFDLHGRSVLPAAHATLPAAGEAQVLLLGRGITAKGAWVRGRILTLEGKPAEGGEVELLTMTPGEAGEPDLVMGKLRAGSLPPGDYLLELRVGREAGPVQAVTARPFLVTERRPV